MMNLLIVFMVSGIWHGANWTYVIWGTLHGIYLVLAIMKNQWCDRIGLTPKFESSKLIAFGNKFLTFHLALFAWIFFRASSVNDAFTIIKQITHCHVSIPALKSSFLVFVTNPAYIGRLGVFLLILALFIWVDPKMDNLIKRRIIIPSPIVKYALYSFILVSIILFGFFGEVQFIYFQF